MTNKPIAIVLGASAVSVLSLATFADAQNDGGRRFSLSLSERIEHSNRPSTEGTYSLTSATAEISSRTRTQDFRLSFSGDLRAGSGNTGIDDKRATMRYVYNTASARLAASLNYREDDIAFLRPSELIEGPDGTIIVPDDTDQISGAGTRNSLNFGANLLIGKNKPFGFRLGISHRDLSYDNTGGSSLNDQQRTTGYLNTRFDILPNSSINAGLRHIHTELENNPNRNVTSASLGWETELKSNRYGITLSSSDTGNGTRNELSATWARNVNDRESFNLNFGVAATAGGENVLTSNSSYSRETRDGNFVVRFRRSARDRSDGDESVVTGLIASYKHELLPETDLFANMSYSETEIIGLDGTATDLVFTTGLLHRLTPDWALSLSVSQTRSEERSGDQETYERLSVSLRRSFGTQF